MPELILRSRIFTFLDKTTADKNYACRYLDDGIIIVQDGIIQSVEATQILERQGFDLNQCTHKPDSLVLAGFIDPHVHSSQVEIIGSYGEKLLDWLEKYTFPEEIKFSDEEYRAKKNRNFISELLKNGTTSAMVFTTVHSENCHQFLTIANEHKMRVIAGKILMDRHAPSDLLDNTLMCKKLCQDIINDWHECNRLGVAITPRFSGTSTREQLDIAGQLLHENETVMMQTHLSENSDELTWTAKLFPDAKDYLNTYENHQLLTDRSVFAHCIHLNESEWSRLADSGARIAFCPSSNLFLGSGLFDLHKAKQKSINVGLATDVGAGTSLSQFKTMSDAYKVCQLNDASLPPEESFYLSSLGAAKVMNIDKFVGSLEVGKEADFIVLNPNQHPAIAKRAAQIKTISEELFLYITMGDERLIEQTYILGKLAYENPPPQTFGVDS